MSMLPLVSLLLGVVSTEPVVDGHHPEAIEVFSCTFDAQTDVNHDRWPDHWKRRRGPQYPTYLPVEIVEAETPTDDRCLQVGMNGGAALIQSPRIPISPLFSYVVEGHLQTSGLAHSKAYISARYFDADHNLLSVAGVSRRLGRTQPWTKLRVGPFSTSREDAAYVEISLHVEPIEDGFDLKGSARFDNIWLARLPRMTLRSNSPHNVFTNPEDVEITCDVSGIQQRKPMMTFELIDLSSRTLAEMNHRLDGKVVAVRSNEISDLAVGEMANVRKTDNGFQGEMTWRPPLDGYGYYRVRVRMLGKSGVMHEREMGLVLVRPLAPPVGGEFGWSIPQGDAQLPLSAIADLLTHVGATWVKFPVWYDDSDRRRADALAHFTEQLNTHRIELVGIIDQPPPQARKLFSEAAQRLPAATVLAERDVWYPALNPVLTRLSLKIRSWQLGTDDDTSFMGHPQLAEKIAELDQQMERLGQKIRLGLPWRWINAVPEEENSPWNFLSFTADPPMTPDEIATYLKLTRTGDAERWVMLKPLPAEGYSVEERARDLVLRMLAAKMNHADVTFATDPFDPKTGLMNPDGTPGELLLPWRTTAYMISGTEYLGSIELPGGSRNYILSRGDKTMMVVWNENETEEVINLGDPQQVEHVDLWGRLRRPEQRGHRQAYQVGPLPTFITGLSREMALWRIEFKFVDDRLRSQFGRPQYPRFRLKNPFGQGVGGTMRVRTPETWGDPLPPVRVNMSGHETRTEHLEITLRSNASSGKERIRVDFDITADRDYRFSLWRTVEVGLGDVVMEFATQMDDDGNLVVEQKMINKTDEPVYFKCFLFPPGRRRLRQNVLNLSRGSNVKTYTLPDGEKLRGETLWVRAEEIYGNRVLNYRFPAVSQ